MRVIARGMRVTEGGGRSNSGRGSESRRFFYGGRSNAAPSWEFRSRSGLCQAHTLKWGRSA